MVAHQSWKYKSIHHVFNKPVNIVVLILINIIYWANEYSNSQYHKSPVVTKIMA